MRIRESRLSICDPHHAIQRTKHCCSVQDIINIKKRTITKCEIDISADICNYAHAFHYLSMDSVDDYA